MSTEPEKASPELRPDRGRLEPVPAPGGGAGRSAGPAKGKRLGLAALAFLAAGLAATVVFKSELKQLRYSTPDWLPRLETGEEAQPGPSVLMPVIPVFQVSPKGRFTGNPAPRSSPLPFFGKDHAAPQKTPGGPGPGSLNGLPKLRPVDHFIRIASYKETTAGGLRAYRVENPARMRGLMNVTRSPEMTAAPQQAGPAAQAAQLRTPQAMPPAQPGQPAARPAAPQVKAPPAVPCEACKADALDSRPGVYQDYGGTAVKPVGEVRLVGLCEGKYIYEFKNTTDRQVNTQFTSRNGETWDFQTPGGLATRFKSQSPLDPSRPLTGLGN